jgi:hypothetical protein
MTTHPSSDAGNTPSSPSQSPNQEAPAPEVLSAAPFAANCSDHGHEAHWTPSPPGDSLTAKHVTSKALEHVGKVCWFPDIDLGFPPPAKFASPPRPYFLIAPSAGHAEKEDGEIDYPALGLDVQSPALLAAAWAGSPPDSIPGEAPAYEEAWPPETTSAEWPGLTMAIYAMEIEAIAVKRNESFAAQVLGELKDIKHKMSVQDRLRSKKKSKIPSEKLTVDQKLKKLHLDDPEAAEEKSLRQLGELFECSQSAFAGGDYYENTLKLKREAIKANKKTTKREEWDERCRAENRQVTRDNRDHVESYEDIDDQIDYTWDERQQGH